MEQQIKTEQEFIDSLLKFAKDEHEHSRVFWARVENANWGIGDYGIPALWFEAMLLSDPSCKGWGVYTHDEERVFDAFKEVEGVTPEDLNGHICLMVTATNGYSSYFVRMATRLEEIHLSKNPEYPAPLA